VFFRETVLAATIMVWFTPQTMIEMLTEMSDNCMDMEGVMNPDIIVQSSCTAQNTKDPLTSAIELIEKIKLDRDTYPVDANNIKLQRTAAQKKLGDGFLKVTVRSILKEQYDSIKGRLETHYDTDFKKIVKAAIVPRRNGKTTEVAIDNNSVLENVPNFTSDVSANSLEQAGIMLDMCKVMCRFKFGESGFVIERKTLIIFQHVAGRSYFRSRPMNLKVKI